MTQPERLRHDPAFRDGLGCDLADEPRALETPDLGALRARILAAGAPPPSRPGPAPPPPRAWPWRSLAAAGLIVSVPLAWTLHAGGPTPDASPAAASARVEAHVQAPSPARPAPAAPAPSVLAPVPRAAPDGKARAVPPVATPAGPDVGTRAAPVGTAQPGAPVEPVAAGASGPVEAPPTRLRSGDLAAQIEAFERAEEHMSAGDHAGALTGYADYLARWPSGSFLTEARFGELRARWGLGQAAEVEALAAPLADAPALSGRRDEILTLRAEALVRLGRCDEARALAAALPRATQRRVRQSCP